MKVALEQPTTYQLIGYIKNFEIKETQQGSKFASITLVDKEENYDIKHWNITPEDITRYQAGIKNNYIFGINTQESSYNNQIQYKVNTFDIDTQNVYPFENFVYVEEHHIINQQENIAYLNTIVKMINNITYSELLQTLFEDIELIKTFNSAPAAIKNHHNHYGGLLKHTTDMLRLAKSICDTRPELDRDLIFTSIIFHDIMKTAEYSNYYAPEMTVRGQLLGHIFMGANLVTIIASQTYNMDNIAEHPERQEDILLLQHCILSHHGTNEWGSPVTPAIPEASVIHYIDNMDATLNKFNSLLSETELGDLHPKRQFSLQGAKPYKRLYPDKL